MSRYSTRLPHDYTSAAAMLRGRKSRQLLGNTVLRDEGDRLVLAYHGNDIAGWTPDGTAQYSTAGWATTSTHERLNAMVPAQVGFIRRDFSGYVSIRNADDTRTQYPSHGAIVTVLADGSVYVR